MFESCLRVRKMSRAYRFHHSFDFVLVYGFLSCDDGSDDGVDQMYLNFRSFCALLTILTALLKIFIYNMIPEMLTCIHTQNTRTQIIQNYAFFILFCGIYENHIINAKSTLLLKYALELIIILFFVSHTVKSIIAIIVIQSEIPGC